MTSIRLATDSSPLSLAQTARVSYRIGVRLRPTEIVDVFVDSPVDPAGRIERLVKAIVGRNADAALCPATHLAGGIPEGVRLAAVLRDRDPRYRCVAPQHPSLDRFRPSASLVTCDLVSRAQIRARFPRLRVDLTPPSWEIFAGLRHGAWDGACLPPEVFDVGSLSGLATEPVPADLVLPAVGQGLVAILCAVEGGEIARRMEPLGEPGLAACFAVERLFLEELGETPGRVASARAVGETGAIELTGVAVQKEGDWSVTVQGSAPLDTAGEEARRLGRSCRELARERDLATVPRGEALVP
jgi:hydroxymethylbilane synthase